MNCGRCFLSVRWDSSACDWLVFFIRLVRACFVDACEVVLCAPFCSACFICHLIRFDVMCVMRCRFFCFRFGVC